MIPHVRAGVCSRSNSRTGRSRSFDDTDRRPEGPLAREDSSSPRSHSADALRTGFHGRELPSPPANSSAGPGSADTGDDVQPAMRAIPRGLEGTTLTRSLLDGTVAPPDALTTMRAYARARVLSLRRQSEASGVLVDGTVYETTDEALIKLATLVVFATRDPSFRASLFTRGGDLQQVDANTLYRVATAAMNHVQTCAAWQAQTLADVDAATDPVQIAAVEDTIDETAPSGESSEPVPPGGAPVPPAFQDAAYGDVECDSLSVSGQAAITGSMEVGGPIAVTSDAAFASGANVAGLATVERLYARDRLARGTQQVYSGVSSNSSTWRLAGSFIWRMGDRPPAVVTVAFDSSHSQSLPAALVFNLSTGTTLGVTYAQEKGQKFLAVAVSGAPYVANDSSAYELDIFIANRGPGNVWASNYLVSSE